jgi:uncharacterized protein (DUF1697 family)
VISRYFAFLRAINVGGHTVAMETLRKLCESFGLSGVETFIASGNLIFQSTGQEAATLERTIASGLQRALGYEVATFIRSEHELAQIAAYRAFPQPQLDAAAAFNIAFLSGPLEDMSIRKLMGLTSAIVSFVSHGCEVYWLCLKRQSESSFSNAVLEKTLGVKSTLRGANTIQKMAARYVSRTGLTI